MAKLLVIDNYDSFTYNLVQMFMDYDLDIQVHRSDKISLDQIEKDLPDYILIGPGPKDPAHAAISVSLVKTFSHKVPMLGVCLGLQCINEAFGGRTIRSPMPMHGKTSRISHNGDGIFRGIPRNFIAARYHSLISESIPVELIVTANSEDGLVMGLSHPAYPLHGVQFHPESFLTDHGFSMIENFLNLGSLHREIGHG